jgi:dTDP-4-dehydrorhamnose reductase
MRIVIVGSTGQLGTDLMKTFCEDHELIGLTHHDIEVSSISSCLTLKERHPDVIINTAAFHKTDQCEEEPEKTFLINAVGPKNVAKISKEIEATIVFVSTDYVFDGEKNKPYTEDDVPNPINTYGISKLAGELFTKQNPKHYVIRTASLFGASGANGKGGNFVETMITKAKKQEPISVVDDQWMSPTYTEDAAKIMKKIIESRLPFGTYHVTNKGFCTWFQFTKQIFSLLNLNRSVTPIKARQLQVKAQRPKFSALKSTKLPKHGIRARGWTEALSDYLIEKGHLQHKKT